MYPPTKGIVCGMEVNMQVVLENKAFKSNHQQLWCRACKHSGESNRYRVSVECGCKILEENCPGTVPLCRKSEK